MMTKDHYVAQTYLEQFCDSNAKLWVYDKQWGKVKPKTTGQVCYEHGGSDNPYLVCERAIEDYLKPFENAWNAAVKIFTSEAQISFNDYLEAKRIIAGYLPYLRFYTPASVRAQKANLAADVKTTLKLLKQMGEIPPPPPGYEFLLDDIEKNISVNVDGKFPKAIAAGVFASLSESFFRFPWMRVENHSNIPFVTSDNPTCFWYPDGKDIPMTYVPLTPKTGLLIKPFVNPEDIERYQHTEDGSSIAESKFVNLLNELVIKNAEKIVIANSKLDLVLEQITTFKNWHFDCRITKIPIDKGELILSRMEAIEKTV